MIDADHFKNINDQYGHQAGDKALCALTSVINHTLRDHDIAGRIGGEEFAIICPKTSLHTTLSVAEDLRVGFKEERLEHDNNIIQFSASLGVSQVNLDNKQENATTILQRADQLLYKAKHLGRNRVCS